MTLRILASDEAATRALGAALARALEPRTVIHLDGPLGAGKTTLARALIQALVPGARVKSPTYALVETYAEASPPIHHLDLYRIVDPEELEFLGLRELADEGAAILVEWPERGLGWLPPADVTLAMTLAPGVREIVLSARSERGERVISRLGGLETSAAADSAP